MTNEVYCTFVSIGGDHKRCVNSGCNRVIRSHHPPERCRFRCQSPEAKAHRERGRLERIASADIATVTRASVAKMAATNQWAIKNDRRAKPIRNELRVLDIISTHCAKKVPAPCLYWTGDQCGHPQARCSNIACAETACPLGYFGEDG